MSKRDEKYIKAAERMRMFDVDIDVTSEAPEPAEEATGAPPRKRRGRFLITIGILLLIAAVVLAGYNIYRDREAGIRSQEILKGMGDFYNQQPKFLLDPNMPMPTIEINGVRYIGKIIIPDLNVDLPVASKWSYAKLYASPCRYSGSAYKGNMVVCAHSYRTHFGRLGDLKIGAQVVFVDVEGNKFYYKVSGKEILQPTQVEEMKTKIKSDVDWQLTLFSCNFNGSARVTVRCAIDTGNPANPVVDPNQ